MKRKNKVTLTQSILTMLTVSGLCLVMASEVKAVEANTETNSIQVNLEKKESNIQLSVVHDDMLTQFENGKHLFMLMFEEESGSRHILTSDSKEKEIMEFSLDEKGQLSLPISVLQEAQLQKSKAIYIIELDAINETQDNSNRSTSIPHEDNQTISHELENLSEEQLLERYEKQPINLTSELTDIDDTSIYLMSLKSKKMEDTTDTVELPTEPIPVISNIMESVDSLKESPTPPPPPVGNDINKEGALSLNSTPKQPNYSKGAEQPTESQLKEWVTSVELVDQKGKVVRAVSDYKVVLINPASVDMEKVGTTDYDIRVETTDNNISYSINQKVSVTIEDNMKKEEEQKKEDTKQDIPKEEDNQGDADKKGKGSPGTPPPKDDKPETPYTNQPKPSGTSNNQGQTPTSTSDKTLPQTGEQASVLTRLLGVSLVGTPIIVFIKRQFV